MVLWLGAFVLGIAILAVGAGLTVWRAIQEDWLGVLLAMAGMAIIAWSVIAESVVQMGWL